MKYLFDSAVLFLGFAITFHTFYKIISSHFELRRQQYFILKRTSLKLSVVMKLCEESLLYAKKIVELKNMNNSDKIDNFYRKLLITNEKIIDIDTNLSDTSLSKSMSRNQIKLICSFLESFHKFKSQLNYRVSNFNGTHDTKSAIDCLDTAIEARFNKLLISYNVLKSSLNVQ